MNKALVIYYVLSAIGLLYAAHMHGKPYGGSWSFPQHFLATAIKLAMIWWMLGWKFI